MSQTAPTPRTPEFEPRHRMSLAIETRDISVREMAEELGVTRATVTNYLHGHTKIPTPVLKLWALRCGVSYDWLTTGETSDPSVPSSEQPGGDGRRHGKTTKDRKPDPHSYRDFIVEQEAA